MGSWCLVCVDGGTGGGLVGVNGLGDELMRCDDELQVAAMAGLL